MAQRKSADVADIFIVKAIHRRGGRGKADKFLVEWEGFPQKKDYTWEPRDNLENCSLFHEFLEKDKMKMKVKARPKKEILVKLFEPTKRGTLSDKERLNIVISQNMKCNLCLTSFHHLLHDLTFEIDHIIPLEQGGSHDWDNLQALCPACHIYKTSKLDRGVIARFLQACARTGERPTKDMILEECQLYYSNRHRRTPPYQEDDMIDFSISAREILNEMCRKKLDRILYMRDLMNSTEELNKEDDKEGEEDTDEKKVSFTIERKRKRKRDPPRPPSKKRKRDSEASDEKTSSLKRLIFFIEQMECLKIESSVVRMDNFKLTIDLNLDNVDKSDKTSHDFGLELNRFFHLCLKEKGRQEITIKDVTLHYEENGSS